MAQRDRNPLISTLLCKNHWFLFPYLEAEKRKCGKRNWGLLIRK